MSKNRPVESKNNCDEKNPLPLNWCWGTILDTGEYINGFAFKPSHRTASGLPIIRIQNLTDETKQIYKTSLNISPEYHVHNGDILVSWSATLDVFIWNRGPALVNQHIFLVKPETKLIEKKLLFYWLKISIQQLQNSEHLHGSTMKHINRGPFMAHQIPIPPKKEQVRITEKLEELLSDLDAGVAELKAAQKKLIQYRQSLLKAAVEGELTAEWRAKRAESNQPVETGAQLLERILKERRKRWEEKQLAKFAEQGKKPPKNRQEKYPEPVQPDTADLPNLPEGWVWASLSQIGWLDRGRSKHRPRNAPHLYSGKYPFVQTGDVREADTFIYTASSSYSEAGLEQSKLWPKNTLCITIAANIGETALLGMEACFPDSLVGFLPATEEISIRYVEYFMRTAKQKLDSEAPATAQKNINLKILERVYLPLPPTKEQEEIARILEENMASAQTQSDTYDLGLRQAAAQRKNILKSAFSGDLVPQDPTDEPATVLLEKIRLEREAFAKKPKVKKPRTKKKEAKSIMSKLIDVLKEANDWLPASKAFALCGVADGTKTDHLETLYEELRNLDKQRILQVRRVGDEDELKLAVTK